MEVLKKTDKVSAGSLYVGRRIGLHKLCFLIVTH